ncbi:MAG: HEAT repeat domain-containing protein [Gemmatimonadota bacterium]
MRRVKRNTAGVPAPVRAALATAAWLLTGCMSGTVNSAGAQPAAFAEAMDPLPVTALGHMQTDWLPQSDTIYKAARRALNQGQYERAAELFNQARDEEPQYAADALYYEALAYSKLGGRNNYRKALHSLQWQLENYPDAATHAEAESLAIRVQADLARLGDPRAAEALQREAARMQAEMERDVQRELARAERDADRSQVELERAQREMERKQEQLSRQQEAELTREQRAEMQAQEAVSRELETKMFALQALMESDPETAIPILDQILRTRTAETAMLRQQAVFLAARLEDDRTTDLMLDILQNDPDPEVRMHAAHWLARSRDPRAASALMNAARSGDSELQEAAVFALGQMPGPESGRALREIAGRSDVDPGVRTMAIQGLAQQPSAENTQYLVDLFEKLPNDDSEAREAALFALSQSPTGIDPGFLYSVAADPSEDPQIREMALFAAARSGSITPNRLGQLYREAESREQKEQVMFALTQSEDPAAFDVLLEIARTETDPDLKQNAVFWVGRSDDPRAKKLMLEILEQ